jgi:hypothetical protein
MTHNVTQFALGKPRQERTGDDYPAPSTEEWIEEQVSEVCQVYRGLETHARQPHSEDQLRAAALRGRKFLAEDRSALRAALEEGSRPATTTDIARHLAVLVGSVATGNREDRDIFASALVADVGAQRPTVQALESACRGIRRTRRYMPAICDVLTELHAAEEMFAEPMQALAEIPVLTGHIEQKLSRLIADRAEIRARQIPSINDALDAGERNLRRFDPSLVEEVRASRRSSISPKEPLPSPS